MEVSQTLLEVPLAISQGDYAARRQTNHAIGVAAPAQTPVAIHLDLRDLNKDTVPFVVINRYQFIVGWGVYDAKTQITDIHETCLMAIPASFRELVAHVEKRGFQLIGEQTFDRIPLHSPGFVFNSLLEYQLTKYCLTYTALRSPRLTALLKLDPKHTSFLTETIQVQRFLPRFFQLYIQMYQQKTLEPIALYLPPVIAQETTHLIDVVIDAQEIPVAPEELRNRVPDFVLLPSQPVETKVTPANLGALLAELLIPTLELPPEFWKARQTAKEACFLSYLDDYALLMQRWEQGWFREFLPPLSMPTKEACDAIISMFAGEAFEAWLLTMWEHCRRYEAKSLRNYSFPSHPRLSDLVDSVSRSFIRNGFSSTQDYDEREYGNIYLPISMNTRARLTSLIEEHRSDLIALRSQINGLYKQEKMVSQPDGLYLQTLTNAYELLKSLETFNPQRRAFGYSYCPSAESCGESTEGLCEIYHFTSEEVTAAEEEMILARLR